MPSFWLTAVIATPTPQVLHILDACAPVVGKAGELHDVLLSKRLTKLLRHTALLEGVQIDCDGWADLAAALQHINQQRNVLQFTEQGDVLRYVAQDVKDMIRLNDKKRFELRERPAGVLQIRCTYGHTMPGLHAVGR